MKFILGKKLEMTQKFKDDGAVVPVTAVLAGPCVVTQLKTEKTDGYSSIQIGFGLSKNLIKPQIGHLKDLDKFKHLKEFRTENVDNIKRGDKIDVGVFNIGDKITVSGVSKGKGFQGVVRRHGFKGSPATHGHKDQLRMPGSSGPTGPSRTVKGIRKPGRMGGGNITVKNLEVIDIDKDNNILFIKGAVPGARNGLLEIVAIN